MLIYTLQLHGLQGDDFQSHLVGNRADPVLALKAWAGSFIACAERCLELAKTIENSPDGKTITADGSDDLVVFDSDDEIGHALLMSLVANGPLSSEHLDSDNDEALESDGTEPADGVGEFKPL